MLFHESVLTTHPEGKSSKALGEKSILYFNAFLHYSLYGMPFRTTVALAAGLEQDHLAQICSLIIDLPCTCCRDTHDRSNHGISNILFCI